MNPAAMVALIDYREIDGEERPVNTTAAVAVPLLNHNFGSDFDLILPLRIFLDNIAFHLFLIPNHLYHSN